MKSTKRKPTCRGPVFADFGHGVFVWGFLLAKRIDLLAFLPDLGTMFKWPHTSSPLTIVI